MAADASRPVNLSAIAGAGGALVTYGDSGSWLADASASGWPTKRSPEYSALERSAVSPSRSSSRFGAEVTFGASLGTDGPGLYEPIHGSAPDIAGRGIANPLATILAAAMLLRHSCALEKEAAAIEQAVQQVLSEGARTADLARSGEATIGTQAMAELVLGKL